MAFRFLFRPIILALLTVSLQGAIGAFTFADDEAASAGFQSLFDGETLEGWDGDPKFWRVEDGAITGQTTAENPTRGNTFLVYRGEEVSDFELQLKFRIVGGNSGIQYRSREVEKWVMSGYQADIDSTNRFSGILYEEKARGILAVRGQKLTIGSDGGKQVTGKTSDDETILSSIKQDDWNDYTIKAVGNHLVQSINGHVTVDVTDEQAAKRAMSGLLALQLHAGPPMLVQFKEIRIKHLSEHTPTNISDTDTKKKKIVFVAGRRSHGYGAHEHRAGCMLLARYVRDNLGDYETVVYENGWPASGAAAFDGAAAVVVYCDGGGGHLLIPHLDEFDQVMKRGVGLACIHYAVEVPKDRGGTQFLNWMGGYFETHWSVNPHWTAKFEKLPEHPITRGVEPFEINDEWYFHMRFREGMDNVTPILSAVAPEATMRRSDGPHSGNPDVRASVARGDAQHVAWAAERPDGGRGFGFTGGHVHWNWGDDNFRKLVLNAIVWIAKGEVPEDGVGGETPSRDELEANQDFEKPQPRVERSRARSRRSPEVATSNLTVHPELTASLFAAEPMLLSPSNIAIDHRGRVWVCEIVNYRAHRDRRQEGDRILILEDTNGDGVADSQKTFYQGRDIDSPHGVCVLGNRVVVSAGPHVLCLTDEDGDDKADKKEVWFTGISGVQHDHGIHEFMFGPDGKLYFNFGNSGEQIKDADGKTIVDMAGNEVVARRAPYQQGMVFRCNPDLSDFETLGWNFRNNWMVTVDSFGTIWQSDNDDDGNRSVRINYVMEFGNYGYRDESTGAGWRSERVGMSADIPSRHWYQNDPGVVPNLLQTGGGSPTGIMVYEGDALPESLFGQLIHCDAGPSVTRAYLVKDDGAGYSAETVNLLSGEKDPWFRPSDVKAAPDGTLFVADWYDPGVGGHNMRDLERGRIFRVTKKGVPLTYEIPEFDFESAAGAVQALQNPNLSVRYLAWKALHEMGDEAEAELATLAQHSRAQYRARALWLLGKIPTRGAHYVEQAMKDKDARIRTVAIRLARQLEDVDQLEIAERLADDPSPQVRRECAIAVRHDKREQAASVWARLAKQHDGHDRWYLEALGIGADQQWDRFMAAWLEAVDHDWDTVAGRDLIWRSRASKTGEWLQRIVSSETTGTHEMPRYLRAIELLPEDQRKQVSRQLAFRAALPDNHQSNFVQLTSLQAIDGTDLTPEDRKKLNALLDQLDSKMRYVELIDRFGVSDRYGDVVELAAENPATSLGIAAITCLLNKQQSARITSAMEQEDRRLALISLLGRSANNRAVPILMGLVNDDQVDSEQRRASVAALGKIRRGAERLIERAEKGDVPASLQQAWAASLHQTAWNEIRERAVKVYPLSPASDKPLPSIQNLSRNRGDVNRGQQLFAMKGTCANCHLVKGKGKQVGPDLSEIGKKLSREAMFESILFPSAGISHNYETSTVILNDGNVLTGIVTSDTADGIELKDKDAVVRKIARDEIDEITRQPLSIMPANLHVSLTEQDLVDIVEYLMQLQ